MVTMGLLATVMALALLAGLAQAAVTLEGAWGNRQGPLPVVLWHGIGDNCCDAESMGSVKALIEKELAPDAYVVSLMLGSTPEEDTRNGFFLNANTQVDRVCQQLAQDSRLKGGFNAVGFSQGAQFLRAYVERCNQPPVKNLISVGGQHQGISTVPHCKEGDEGLCATAKVLLALGAYKPMVQQHLVPAEYWHDPSREEEYRKSCIFLPDINNDRDTKNETYKANLQTLNKFVMIKFLNDTVVTPKESSWFGWFKPGSKDEMVQMEETDLYKEDWLGLQHMDRKGRLVFMSVAGDHLEVDNDWFVAHIVRKYLQQ